MWLYDFFKTFLKDNQNYQVCEGVLNNTINSNLQNVILNKENKRNHYNNSKVFQFVKFIETRLNNIDISKNIILFNNKEYEHNQDAFYIKIRGESWDDFKLETGNLIGYLKKENFEINISSRFGNKFVKYIIADVDGFLNIEDFGGREIDDSMNWLLEYVWCTKLKRAYRLGLPKTYVKETYINTKVKGKIDVNYFLINKEIGRYKSISRNHSFYSDQNLLILESFKYINKDFLSNELFLIKQAFTVASFGRKKYKSELLKVKSFTNPFYSDYNEVLELSKIILKNESIDFGSDSKVSGFLFDVSMLFEHFIRKIFKRNGFVIQNKNEKQIYIPTGTTYNRNLYPDLIATFENKTYLFDIKYKSFDERYGVNREDLFQIYTYLGQLGNSTKVDYFGFIYPTSKKRTDYQINQEVVFMGKKITFLVCFLYIPEESSLFSSNFKQSIELFIQKIKQTK